MPELLLILAASMCQARRRQRRRQRRRSKCRQRQLPRQEFSLRMIPMSSPCFGRLSNPKDPVARNVRSENDFFRFIRRAIRIRLRILSRRFIRSFLLEIWWLKFASELSGRVRIRICNSQLYRCDRGALTMEDRPLRQRWEKADEGQRRRTLPKGPRRTKKTTP